MSRWLSIGPIECLLLGFIVAAVLVVLLLAAFLLMRSSRSAASTTTPLSTETPLDVLRRRLAAGEITLEQFDELRGRIDS